MYIIDDHLRSNGIPRYSNVRKTSGKPSVDRMISSIAFEHFSLFDSIVFASDDRPDEDRLQEENNQLREELMYVKDQLSNFDNCAEMFDREAKKKENKIAELKAENISMKYEIDQIKDEMGKQVRALKDTLRITIHQHQEERDKILQLSVLEAELNAKAIEKCLKEINTLESQISSLKRVVRVPRLAKHFQELYERVPMAEQLGAHLRAKLVNEMLSQDDKMEKYDHDCILHALRSQFTRDFDIEQMRKRALAHIEAIPVSLKSDPEDVKKAAKQVVE